jgi:hypothetical protein
VRKRLGLRGIRRLRLPPTLLPVLWWLRLRAAIPVTAYTFEANIASTDIFTHKYTGIHPEIKPMLSRLGSKRQDPVAGKITCRFIDENGTEHKHNFFPRFNPRDL